MGGKISIDQAHEQYTLKKLQQSRLVISNYNPALLAETERQQLDDESQMLAPNDVPIDIRAGLIGGRIADSRPVAFAKFQQYFVFHRPHFVCGTGTGSGREQRSQNPPVSENPVSALAIRVTDDKPNDTLLAVNYTEQYYSAARDPTYPWNEAAFRVLAQIYQMTMSELPKGSVPTITISK